MHFVVWWRWFLRLVLAGFFCIRFIRGGTFYSFVNAWSSRFRCYANALRFARPLVSWTPSMRGFCERLLLKDLCCAFEWLLDFSSSFVHCIAARKTSLLLCFPEKASAVCLPCFLRCSGSFRWERKYILKSSSMIRQKLDGVLCVNLTPNSDRFAASCLLACN